MKTLSTMTVMAALMLAAPVAAQDRMSEAQCADSWEAVQTLVQVPSSFDGITTDENGWCVIENGRFNIERGSAVRLDSLRWQAGDVERFNQDGLPPRTLEIVAEGFGILPETGDPIYDYLLGLQSSQAVSKLGLSARWDGVQNAVIVEELYVEFSPFNWVSANGRIEGIDLTDKSTIQTSIGSMGLTALEVTAEFDGWFEAFVALPLGAELLVSDDTAPEDQVEALKLEAIAALDQIPDTLMTQTHRDNLAMFIDDLPRPRGSANLQITADPGLGTARAAPLMLMGAEPTLQQIMDIGLSGVSVLFDWTPKGDEQ